MFNPLRNDINDRFSATEAFLAATRKFKGDLDATAKGLVFIQLYAVYEFTVRSVVQVSIDSINAHGHKMKDLAPALLALYLDPELDSLRNVGRKGIWSARLKLFDRAFGNDVISLSNAAGPPTDGTHYRHSHLILICRVFGIKRMPVHRRRHLIRIDEVVNNRNQIAHGGETAFEIGRRYTAAEMAHIIRQIKSVCLLVVLLFETFCTDASRHTRA